MDFPKETEVVIIGGGLLGCSVGYRLAKAGMGVVILEMRNIASGASGRNGGQVIQLDGRDCNKKAILNRLTYTKENNRLLPSLAEELKHDFEYNRCGGLDIAITDEEWGYFKEKLVPFQKKVGDDEVTLLDRKETKEIYPLLSNIVKGARFRATDGTLNPFQLNLGFASAAKRHQAKVFTHTPVEKIVIKNGKAIGVQTKKGYLKSQLIINAANAWAPLLTPEIDILPLRQVAVVTERVPEFPVYVTEAVLDNQVIFCSVQQKSGNLIVGGLGTEARKRNDHYQEELSPDEICGSTAIFNIIFKGLGDISIIRTWAGTMAFTADGLPCVGPVPKIENLFIVAGFSNGMAFAPIIGKLVAEDIVSKKPSLSLKPFNPKRFYKQKINWPKSYNYTALADFLNRR